MKGVRSALLRWYRRNARDLPWRRSRDPYAIWVSEIMLQQTQVATVLPYYERFMERYPDVASLARAGEEEVLAAWSGLGYYRRARALHAGAREVQQRHAGRLPSAAEQLRKLPGIGRYTAGAIASIAFDLPEPVLDGNVRRVLARLHALDAPTPAKLDRRLWPLAAELARGRSPGELNQALMELGATVCTPRTPDCPRCPLRRRCVAHERGDEERFPRPVPRPEVAAVRVAAAVVTRGERILLERRSVENPLRGTWEIPAVELPGSDAARSALRDALRRRHQLDVTVGAALPARSHGIMNRALKIEPYRCRLLRGRVARNDELRWVALDALDGVAVSGATRKVVDAFTG